MGIEVKTGSAYHDVVKTEPRVPSITISETLPDTAKSNSQNDANNEKSHPEKTDKQIKDAISSANKKLRFAGTRCEFTYYDDINRVAIKVIDKGTDEVIREIPPEETLELIEKLWEFAGLLYDEKG